MAADEDREHTLGASVERVVFQRCENDCCNEIERALMLVEKQGRRDSGGERPQNSLHEGELRWLS